jgi:hypothetical protein
MPGSPEGEQPNFSIPPAPVEKRYPRDTLIDYSAMFAYIRMDKSTPDFIQDLRDNKTHLLACFNEILEDSDNPIHKEPSDDMRRLKTNGSIVYYLDKMLKLHVFDMDPYEEYRVIPREKAANEFSDWIKRGAKDWRETHPGSEAAKAVAVLGHHAIPQHHHKLLHEMLPTFVPLLTGHSEKKS